LFFIWLEWTQSSQGRLFNGDLASFFWGFAGEESTKSVIAKTNRKRRSLCCYFCKFAGVDANVAITSCLMTISPGFFIFLVEKCPPRVSSPRLTDRKRLSLHCFLHFFLYLAGVDTKERRLD